MSATVNKSVYKIRTKFKRQLEAAGLSADALDSVIFDSKKLEEWKMASALWKMSFPGVYGGGAQRTWLHKR